MKFKKKVLGSLLTLIMAFSLFSMTVLAAPTTEFTITSVTYSGTARTASEEFSTITEIVYVDGGVETTLPIASDELATLTIDGIQYDIVAGDTFEYNQEAVINLTLKDATNLSQKWGPGLLFSPLGLSPMDPPLDYYFRAAAYINQDGLQDGLNGQGNYSVLKAIMTGYVTDEEANDVVIFSMGSYFNGFYIDSYDYAINGLYMTLFGDGGDDFSGWGAGVTVTGTDSNVTIDSANITSIGAIRTAIWAGGNNTTVDVTNSVIQAFGADTTSESYQNFYVPMLNRVPWVLGLEGTTRATNVLGSATANYSDSIVVSENWGALSTDSGVSGTNALNVSNVLAGIGYLEFAMDGVDYDAIKTVDGIDYGLTIANSGYVTYSDAGVINNYDNVQFYAPDYDIILAAGTSSAYFTGEDTVVNSNRIGAMWHQNKEGILSLTNGTWSASDIMFLVKTSTAGGGQDNSCYPNLVVEGTELNITGTDNYSGVLYQLMDTDDAGGPFMPTGYEIPAQEADWTTVTEATEEIAAADATFINVDTVGDIYNSVYTISEDLNVTFEDSTITGVISSSNANHVYEDGSIIPAGTFLEKADETSYLALGRIVNTASEAVNNDVNLELVNSTWVATGTSYLSLLSIDETSEIIVEDGYTVKLLVNGVETAITAGEYTGDIVIERTAVVAGEETTVDNNTTGNTTGTIATNTATNATTNISATSVKTGDNSQAIIWVIMSGVALLVILGGGVYYYYNKRQKSL